MEPMAEKKPSDMKMVAENRKARHEYEIMDRMEAGLVLLGTEVKAARQGRVNLKDSYVSTRGGELYLVQCHISPYTHSYYDNHDPLRERKLLMHKQEIRRLIGKITERGLTLIPLRVYFRKGVLKVELGLGRGKKAHDRRAAVRDRELKRDVEAQLKERNR